MKKEKERSVKETVLDELRQSIHDWWAPTDKELKEAQRLYRVAIKAVRADKKK